MTNLFLDPVSFFRSTNRLRWGIALLTLVGIQFVGVATLFVRMTLFIPDEGKSFPVIGYVVGLGVSAFLAAVFSIGIAFTIFYTLTWFSRERIPPAKLLATFCYALITGHLATLSVRMLLIFLSSGSTPLSQITNATTAAAFVDNPPPYLTAIDPFLLWSVILLTLGYREITGGETFPVALPRCLPCSISLHPNHVAWRAGRSTGPLFISPLPLSAPSFSSQRQPGWTAWC